jgi:hypothetical protein
MWSKSAWVAISASTRKPAWSSTAGSVSSSSGRQGESISIASPGSPARRATAFVRQIRLVRTSASRLSATARTGAGPG